MSRQAQLLSIYLFGRPRDHAAALPLHLLHNPLPGKPDIADAVPSLTSCFGSLKADGGQLG